MPGFISASETRRTETPNATMTTLASPTLGGTAGLSMWQVEMAADTSGPLHVFDSEQLWTVLEGTVSIAIGDEALALAPGDTAVLPAGAQRQVTATSTARLLVCGHGGAIAQVPGEHASRGTPAWVA